MYSKCMGESHTPFKMHVILLIIVLNDEMDQIKLEKGKNCVGLGGSGHSCLTDEYRSSWLIQQANDFVQLNQSDQLVWSISKTLGIHF
jgi:hypothetical protein